MSDTPHVSVLLAEVLAALLPAAQGAPLFIDGTLGAGGHAEALLRAVPTARLLGIDRDPNSLRIARQRLAHVADRVIFAHANYDQMAALAAQHGFTGVCGILLDLGIASMHVDTADRGFSFRADAPLDMRYDPESGVPTAADLLNTLSADAIADLLYTYGEERESRRLARAIVAARPLHSTAQLAAVIQRAATSREKIHPATRTFQALRIAVNDELGALERALPQIVNLLRAQGRMAIISFHSLEDRIVKQFLARESTDCLCPPRQIVCTCGHKASLRLVSRKPITASAAEITANPRSRSAKLRVAERL
ncbi:MAG: 16S rRNA (cytosine(1402)-N(4))-methyltransferase RsmH [Chloroflexi bacterium CFX4]|nr:16S rRNA (cytosine(1402)-N(4))-methyltransferase RsmH [Chloroflexi bacterium CFX4]MDL1924213.1 16S rRNA (cytosine(1402)-N(4))-methyltransferase RsmH [Chloroflexi bacterium CFX3]